MLRWDELTGASRVFRSPSDYSNGNTRDRKGWLVSCSHGSRRVTRTEHDGSITVIADRFEGKRFNSPNDLVVRSDGSIWFTDPSYGIDSNYEGHRSASEIGSCNVFRFGPATGALSLIGGNFVQPNGLALALDESQLYIVDTRRNHIRRFTTTAIGVEEGDIVFAECTAGRFDGIRLDDAGRIWAGSATVSTASIRMARCWASCICRRKRQTSPSAGCDATTCSSRRRRRCTQFA